MTTRRIDRTVAGVRIVILIDSEYLNIKAMSIKDYENAY